MEWFQAALDRYKQQQPQSRPTVRIGRVPSARTVPGEIVYTHTRSLQIPTAVLREKRIVEGFDSGAFVDAFKILRTQVTHRVREKGWNVIGVTSPGNLEGKTLTAVNLAVTMAMDVTQSVLLVDANLQHPTIHEVFDLGPCRGLADHLLDDIPIEKLLVHPGIGRFVLLPGGRAVPHSAEALTSPKMIALVDEFKHRYPSRMIMIDLPPLLHSSDVLAFAPYIDALLIVVEEGRTHTEDLERALSLVKDSTPLLGTVLNKAGRTRVGPAEMKKLL
ncbi:MAG: Putative Exopolysaccharide biosynthesis related tyrosine-protein kinase [Nitrospira sp.]|nr:MAG: Putative Exopolysaccharide biosynthesis related tyrosine-protein kinase [Nitrospira sp.]